MNHEIIIGDVRYKLKDLLEKSIQTVITSPPYWGLRDYGNNAQIGLEQTLDEYVEEMVNVFRKVKQVLKDDGTLWLNLGDSYSKDKNLTGIPWKVAIALQKDGWILRQDIIWSKPNPMPESITDRCTKSHEYIFLFSKEQKYYFNHEAIKEPSQERSSGSKKPQKGNDLPGFETRAGLTNFGKKFYKTRNKRSVWTIAPQPFKGSHFAVMPEALVEPCILAGSRENDLVFDPFAGSGTVGVVAKRFNRNFIGIELNAEYAQIAEKRIKEVPF